MSIIIINYNGVAVLPPCLESVYRQPYRPIDVIVIDNGSSDGSVELVKSRFPDVRLIVNAANRGFAEANNQGVEAAVGDRIVLLNNDTVVDRDWLNNLLDEAEQMGAGVTTSKVVTEGVPETFYEMNGTINYLGYNIMREFKDLSQVFFAGGASLTFSRQDVGMPFLNEYFLYHEDVFLSWRMRLRGSSVRMAQTSLVQHVGSATTRRQPSALVTFYQERNRLLNCLLMYERGTLARLVPFFMVDVFAKLLLSLIAGRKSTAGILRSYGWCMRNSRWIRARRSEIQRERKVRDREIMCMMSPRLIDSAGLAAKLVNSISRIYADAVGLEYHA